MVNEHRKTFLKNSAAQYALQLAKYILPFVTLPYLTRVLGVEGYAVRAYVLAVMSFAQLLLEFGFNLHGAKLVAGFKDDVERVEKTIGSILASKLVLQIIGFPIIFGMCVAIPLMGENIPFTFLCYLSICFSVLMPDFIFMAYEKLGILTSRYVISKLLYSRLLSLRAQMTFGLSVCLMSFPHLLRLSYLLPHFHEISDWSSECQACSLFGLPLKDLLFISCQMFQGPLCLLRRQSLWGFGFPILR